MASAAIMTGCSKDGGKKSANASQDEVATGQMTYRTGKHGEKVSILGYGCMRFPTKSGASGREDRNGELDQEQIDRLIGYAIEHGVNLFAVRDGQDLLQNRLLIVQQGPVVQLSAEMKIGQMQKSHEFLSLPTKFYELLSINGLQRYPEYLF